MEILSFILIIAIALIFQEGAISLIDTIAQGLYTGEFSFSPLAEYFLLDDNNPWILSGFIAIGISYSFQTQFYKNEYRSYAFLQQLILASLIFLINPLGELIGDRYSINLLCKNRYLATFYDIPYLAVPVLCLFAHRALALICFHASKIIIYFLTRFIFAKIKDFFDQRLKGFRMFLDHVKEVEKTLRREITKIIHDIYGEKKSSIVLYDNPAGHEDLNDAQKNLARVILENAINVHNSSPFVIGIESSWGSGKSSLLEGIREHHKSSYKNKITYTEFKPWLLDGQEKIRDEFFKNLAKTAREINPQISNLLLNYKQALNKIDNTYLQFFLNILSFNEPSQERFNKISELLQHQQQNILIVIDDLDRLEKEELLEVFKLVRSSADFPRLVFILLYDKQNIQRILGENPKKQSSNYLDKIVNQEFNMPAYSEEKWFDEFSNSLRKILRINPYLYSAEFLRSKNEKKN